jgi:hypothetical protein
VVYNPDILRLEKWNEKNSKNIIYS